MDSEIYMLANFFLWKSLFKGGVHLN